ncbi:lysosomal acid glucosylceramidase isoform X2 [Folsomia candida]|uniref:lysosomal acid glucosylceramidase isoform X2 n=1 Tax=Folsomia candida TaxID=158441 RepID=UPI00160503F6|nr:lysosomal acid glucosylceramidase isoform X2 [Folsomia candida]
MKKHWFPPLLFFAVMGLGNPQEDQDRPCIPRDFGRGSIVCVCNSTYCDFASVKLLSPHDNATAATEIYGQSQFMGLPVQVWTSSKTGSRFHKSIIYFNQELADEPVVYDSQHFLSPTDSKSLHNRGKSPARNNGFSFFQRFAEISGLQPYLNEAHEFTDAVTAKYAPPLNEINLFRYVADFPRPNRLTKFTIRQDVQYQKVLGIGAAFTDAAGINIASLSRDTQENLMKSYFGRSGNNYSMGRVPMGGTDFSTRPYTLDDMVDHLGGTDLNLTAFALQPEDFKLKIPYIRWAESIRNESLKLVASPWSAPAWMKTNNDIKGRGVLKTEYYQLWADYFVRFLRDYQKEGINIWGVTTGNEPLNGLIPGWPFNCMGWKSSDMKKWIATNLGPTLALLKPELDVKIITLDDNKGTIPTWSKEILDDDSSARYVDGIGTHWYFDFLVGSDVVSRFHKKYPDYFILQTESCLGFTPWEVEKVIVGSWSRAEQYLEAIIRDMRNWVGGFLDWNLALDLDGGPNWAKLTADAAILVNHSRDEFFKQPIFYAIGHISKFVPPDSVRIDLLVKDAPRNLLHIAFLRPDKAVVVIFLNRLNYDVKISLYDKDRGTIRVNIPALSFQTLVYQ